MDWNDLGLRLIRASGALASALAGIAALLTDGAFTKGEGVPSGRWKDFPFARYKITAWGATLLSVILVAPTVQFVGDWMKDANDAKTLRDTAGEIRRDIDPTVNESTDKARQDILGNVRTESKRQLDSAQQVITEQSELGARTSNIAKDAENILTDVNRALNPLSDMWVTYFVQVPEKSPELANYSRHLENRLRELTRISGSTLSTKEATILESRDGVPSTANFLYTSPLAPQKDEVIPYYVLQHTGVWLDFYQTKSRPDDPTPHSPDLTLEAFGSDNSSIDYNFATGALDVRGSHLRVDPPFRTNGRINSVLDLAGTQLTVRLDDTTFPALAADGGRTPLDLQISGVRAQLQLQTLFLDVKGREFFLNERNLRWKRVETRIGMSQRVTYEMTLPRDLRELELFYPRGSATR